MKLELFYFDECPYCQLVLSTMNELGLKEIELKNTRKNPEYAQKLFQDTGRRTVPCLYIDGKPMHESREIAAWLKAHYA